MGIYTQDDHDRAANVGGWVLVAAVALGALALLMVVVAW